MKPVRPLPEGTYIARCREKTVFAAAANGHSAIWPESKAISDGKEVRFFRDGQDKYVCNATYAALNFAMTLVEDSGH